MNTTPSGERLTLRVTIEDRQHLQTIAERLRAKRPFTTRVDALRYALRQTARMVAQTGQQQEGAR